MFYLVVVKEVMSFVFKLWAVTEAMVRVVERIHVSFLNNITGKRARRTTYRMWVIPADGEVLKAYGM